MALAHAAPRLAQVNAAERYFVACFILAFIEMLILL
jgi:hypothetical protein